MRSIGKGDRVLDERGLTATVIKLDQPRHPIIAFIRYDWQNLSSPPKPKPIALLTLLSPPLDLTPLRLLKLCLPTKREGQHGRV